MSNEKFLEVQGIPLAYNQYLSNSATVGLMFLGGFASDKEGSKALALEAMAKTRDYDFLRFDYLAHGNSDGDFQTAAVAMEIAGCETDLFYLWTAANDRVTDIHEFQTDTAVGMCPPRTPVHAAAWVPYGLLGIHAGWNVRKP